MEFFNRSWLVPGEHYYWPFDEYPETEMWAYSLALTEYVLRHNEKARTALAATIQRWYTPGCQKVISQAMEHHHTARIYYDNVVKAVSEHKPVPSWPESWAKAVKAQKNNADFASLMSDIVDFITETYNRKEDLLNRKPKVIAENAAFLLQAVTFRSLVEYSEFDPRPWTSYKTVRLGDKIYDIHNIMIGKPTTREERRIKRNIIRVYRREGYYLCHNVKLLKDAERWYKSRVDPGSIEEYLNELGKSDIYQERSNIEQAIAACDAATGYPRKWRK